MEVIIGIACVIGFLGLLRWFVRTNNFDALVGVGAVRRQDALHALAKKPEFIPLAYIGRRGYENLISAQLHEDGILLVHKVSEQGVLLPLKLLTTTDRKWTYPLEFGSGSNRIRLNLGSSVTVAEVQRMKQKKESNQASDATSEPAPGADSSAHQG